jgi:uncharacterized protein (DUF885 family)
MRRRNFLLSGGAIAGMAALPSLAQAATTTNIERTAADNALTARLNVLFYEELAFSPESTTGLGLDKGTRFAAKSMLDPRDAAARQSYAAFGHKVIAEVEQVDPATLGAAGKRHRDLILYRYRTGLTSSETFGIDAVQMPYRLTQQGGAYFSVPDMLDSQHTIETAADCEAYLSRLAAFRVALDQDNAEQRAQAPRGLVAPAWSLDLTLGQMRKLHGGGAADSSLVRSLVRRAQAKGIAGDWQSRAAKIVESEVFPAVERQFAMVEELRRTTPEGDGAWRIKQGDVIYAAALAEATTTNLSPEAVHKLGLEQVADLTARLDGVLRQGGFTQRSVGERLTALNHSAEQLYPNTDAARAELIASLNAGIEAMASRLPQAFSDIPHEKLEIRRVPVEIQDGASNGYYYSAALDGSRPGIYWINLKDMGDWPKYSLPTLTYHEGIPGHHLQGGYARLDPDLPLSLQNWFISSYGEGWALYAEQLADELGGDKGLERAGFLQSLLFRAARLVVDTGIHHYRWSREQATDYMAATTGFARPRCQREVERYCTFIGQACSYKIGHSAWVAARAKAKAELGVKFSLPWFHEVLKEGVMPIAMLQARIDERVQQRKMRS